MEDQLLINALIAHLGTSSHLSGNPANQALEFAVRAEVPPGREHWQLPSSSCWALSDFRSRLKQRRGGDMLQAHDLHPIGANHRYASA